MVEPIKEHTVTEDVRKSFLSFAVAEVPYLQQIQGTASSASARPTARQLCFIIRWIKDSVHSQRVSEILEMG